MAWRGGSSERICCCLLFAAAFCTVTLLGMILWPIVMLHLPSHDTCDGGSTICTALVCHARGSQPRSCTGEETVNDHDGHGMLVNGPCQLTFDVPHNVPASCLNGFVFWKRSKSAVKSLSFSNQTLCLPTDHIHSLCQPVHYHDTLDVYSFTTIDGMGNVLMYFVDGELSVLVDVRVRNKLKINSSSGSADLWKTFMNCSDHHETPQQDIYQLRVTVLLVTMFIIIIIAPLCIIIPILCCYCYMTSDLDGDFCCFYQCNCCNCLKLMSNSLGRMVCWTVAKGNSLCMWCKGLRLRRGRVAPLVTATPSDDPDHEYVQEKASISVYSNDIHSIISAVSEKGRDSGELATSNFLRLTDRSPSCRKLNNNVTVFRAPTTVFVRPVRSEISPDLPSLKHYIVLTVAAKMKPFGIFLGVENKVVDKVTKNNPMDCERACEEMLKLWLTKDTGTGDRPRTWATVITALEEAGYREQAIALKRELNERDSPV